MKKKIIVLSIVALLLAILSFVGYHFARKKDSIAYDNFDKALDNLYKYIEKYINDSNGIVSINISYDSNKIVLEDKYYGNEIINAISGNHYRFNYDLDFKNKILLLNHFTSYNDGDSMNIKVNYQDNYKYFYVEDNYDKYVKQELENNEYNKLFNRLTLDDKYLDIVSGIIDFAKVLNGYTVLVGKETIEIGDISKKVDASTLTFDKNMYDHLDLHKNELLINNTKFKDAYKDKFDKEFDYDNIKNMLKYLIDLKTEIRIYTNIDTGEFYGFSITTSTKEYSNTYTLIKIEDNKYDIDLLIDGFVVEGTLVIEDDAVIIKLNSNIYNLDTLNIMFTIKLNKKDKIDKPVINKYYNYGEVFFDKEFEVYMNVLKREEVSNLYNLYIQYKLALNPDYIEQPYNLLW